MLRPRQVKFAEVWNPLEKFVQTIITCNFSSTLGEEWNARIFDVYTLCVASPQSLGEELYQEMKTFLEDYVTKLCASVESGANHNLLRVYHRLWQEYNTGSSYLNKLFGFLNRQRQRESTYRDLSDASSDVGIADRFIEIKELALHIWRQRMLEPLKERLVKLLLDGIHTDRMGGTVNTSIIHSVIQSLVDVEEYNQNPLSLHDDAFETPYLRTIKEYYMSAALKLKELGCSQYTAKVISRLDNEDLRTRKFLNPNSYEKVRRECLQRLVGDHLQFLYAGCKDMVKQERTQDLKHMYELLSQITEGLNGLIMEVELHIKQTAQKAVTQLTDDNIIATKFVEVILEVHSKYTSLIKNVFNADQQFIGALDRACEAAINMKINPKTVCKAPEWLAKFCDTLLKKSTKGFSESERDNGLSQSLIVFKYLHDKDLFERFYSRMLAKRLIKDLSHSMDAEEAMIRRLQQACGIEFTNKLHRMFTDVRLSPDLNSKFSDAIKETGVDLGMNFTIHVLQAGAWPLGQNLPTFLIPQELEQSISQFETFYVNTFRGRRLTWIHSLCCAEVKFLYLPKLYFVGMNTFQMAVLLGYESQDNLTLMELQAITQLPEKELLKQVQSLVNAKILLADSGNSETSTSNTSTSNTSTSETSTSKTSTSENSTSKTSTSENNTSENHTSENSTSKISINENTSNNNTSENSTRKNTNDDDDVKETSTSFSLNMNYSNNKRTKFNVTVQKAETQKEVKNTHAQVEEDRKICIQATIVRIMKSRKSLNHDVLIQEVVSQISSRFAPKLSMIKKCIEKLIEKEYMERSEGCKDVYSYIA